MRKAAAAFGVDHRSAEPEFEQRFHLIQAQRLFERRRDIAPLRRAIERLSRTSATSASSAGTCARAWRRIATRGPERLMMPPHVRRRAQAPSSVACSARPRRSALQGGRPRDDPGGASQAPCLVEAPEQQQPALPRSGAHAAALPMVARASSASARHFVQRTRRKPPSSRMASATSASATRQRARASCLHGCRRPDCLPRSAAALGRPRGLRPAVTPYQRCRAARAPAGRRAVGNALECAERDRRRSSARHGGGDQGVHDAQGGERSRPASRH